MKTQVGKTKKSVNLFQDKTTGSNLYANPNKIYMVSLAGEYLGEYDQAGSDEPDASRIGMNDLAYGDNLLWGSDNSIIYAMNPETGEEVRRFEGPYARHSALAYDDDNDILYVANYMQSIVALDPNDGSTLEFIPLHKSINGMGYLSACQDGYTLWFTCRENNINSVLYKVNPETEDIVIVSSLSPNNQEVFGLSFVEEFQGCFHMGFGMIMIDGVIHLMGWNWTYDVTWVSVAPLEGNLAPGEGITIDAVFDRENLLDGIYTSYLVIDQNGLIPADDIQIRLLVGEAPVGEYNRVIDLPTSAELEQPYPNPFNETAMVQFSLPEAAVVELIVFDILGRQVMTLQQGELHPGYHNLHFDGSELSSGVYFLRMQTNQGFSRTVKMMLLK